MKAKSLPLHALERIDRVCLEFEAASKLDFNLFPHGRPQMKTAPNLCAAIILAVASAAICADDADNGQPQDQFIGEWINVDEQTRSTKRVVITKVRTTWYLRTWGSGGGGTTEIPHKQRRLHLLGSGAADKSLEYGFASYSAGFKQVHNVVQLEEDQLVVESFNIFKDRSGRSNYRVREVFQRKKGKHEGLP